MVGTVRSQGKIVNIESKYFNIDTIERLVLINQNVDELNVSYPEPKGSISVDHTEYTFIENVVELEVGRVYNITDEDDRRYTLYFTELPIINIASSHTIVDEPKVLAHFTMCEPSGNYIVNNIGIEYRGGSTQSLAKKSFKVEFWEDANGSSTTDFCLLDMRCDDDWNLQAMCNEPLRLRSKLGYELWNKIDTLYYHKEESSAINGVRQEYVELFVDSAYRGLYALSERIDRKQLQLKKYDNGEIKGELYKGIAWGASTFTDLPPFNNQKDEWSGFEYKYPDSEIEWANIHEFVDFVIHEEDISFYENYSDRFNIDNAVNYFIFLNLLRATDNAGKNLFIAKYDKGEPYFYIPWDLDGSFGTIWDGSIENITDDILTNGFYRRLILDDSENGFTVRLAKRWNELRSHVLETERLIQDFTHRINYLQKSGVYERELKTWTACESYNQSIVQYTIDWLTQRLDYLDEVFNNPDLLTSINHDRLISNTSLNIYPNPATNAISIEASDVHEDLESIVIVNNLGVSVLSIYIQSSNVNMDVSNLNSGIYYVVATFSNRSRIVEKLLIHK